MGKGNFVRAGEDDDSTTVIFCLPEKVGVLADALKIFQVCKFQFSQRHLNVYDRKIQKQIYCHFSSINYLYKFVHCYT